MQLILFDNKSRRIPYKRVVDKYNAVLVPLGFPECLNLSNSLKRSLRARWKEVVGLSSSKGTALGIDTQYLRTRFLSEDELNKLDAVDRGLLWFERFFKYVGVSRFLSGHNRYGWKPNLEWILQRKNFYNILSGKYHMQAAGHFRPETWRTVNGSNSARSSNCSRSDRLLKMLFSDSVDAVKHSDALDLF